MAHIQGKKVTAVTIDDLVAQNNSTALKVDSVFLLAPPNKIQDSFFYYEINPKVKYNGPIIATLGEFSTGKSWFFNKFCYGLPSGDDLNTAGLNFKHVNGDEIDLGVKRSITICDTQGSDQALCVSNLPPAVVNQMFHEKKAEDLLLRSVVYNVADAFVFICNDMSFEQQSQIDNFANMLSKTKQAPLQDESKRAKQCSNHIYVIHNFRSVKLYSELMKKWEEVKTNYGHIAVQISKGTDSQGGYTIEYLGDQDFSQRHFFLGCENPNNFARGENDMDYCKIKQLNDRTILALKKMLLIEVNKDKEVILPTKIGEAIRGALDRSVIISKQDDTPNDLNWFKHPNWQAEKEASKYKGVYQLRYKGKNIAVSIREDIADSLNNDDEISEATFQKMYSSSFPFQVNITEYQNEAYVIDILAGLVKGENENYKTFCVLSEEKAIKVDENNQPTEAPTTSTGPLQSKGYSVRRVKKGIMVKLIRSPSLLVHPVDDKFRPKDICEFSTLDEFKQKVESGIIYEKQSFKYGEVFSQFFPIPDGYCCKSAVDSVSNPKDDRTEYKFANGLLRIVCPALDRYEGEPSKPSKSKSVVFVVQDEVSGNGNYLYSRFNIPNQVFSSQKLKINQLQAEYSLDKDSLIIWCTDGNLDLKEYKSIRERFHNIIAVNLLTTINGDGSDVNQEQKSVNLPLGVDIGTDAVKPAPVFTFICKTDHYFINTPINIQNGKEMKQWVVDNYLSAK